MQSVVIFLATLGLALAGHNQQVQQVAYAAPQVAQEVYKSAAPQTYAQEVQAAAIRNVETVGVTKTITPVITKTTTHQTHSEPALSVGHVQGYTQSAHGPGKVAQVQYNTQYTQYLNPTVGVNGPVTYAGPAIGQGVAVQEGVAVAAAPQPVQYQAQPAYNFAQPALVGAQNYAYAQPALVANNYQAYAQPAQFVQQQAYAQPAQFAQQAYAQPAHYAQNAHAHAQPQISVAAYDAASLLSSAGYNGELSGHGAFKK